MHNHPLSCFFVIFLISFHISQAPTLAIDFCWKFRVHIINALSHDILNLHCYSYNDDLGEHTLGVGGDFTFKFGQSPIYVTRFWCDMKYGSSHSTTVDVWTAKIGDKHCCHTRECFWSVREDGFYLSDNNQSWVKWYNWP